MRQGFVIHHNGPAAKCIGQPHARCERFWAAVKRYHVEDKGWSDIAYSFGVCPHGHLFTGRGWNKSQFANGKDVVGVNDGPDSQWFTVLVFLGIGEAPTEAMVEATGRLIDTGRMSRRCGTRVLPHNAFKRKACPGPEFTALAKKWDRAPITEAEAPKEADDDMQQVIAFYDDGDGGNHAYLVTNNIGKYLGPATEPLQLAEAFLKIPRANDPSEPLDAAWQELAVLMDGPLCNIGAAT